jgi:hypothetical protein
MSRTIAEVSNDTLKIETVLKNSKTGDFLAYGILEDLSGVKMDNKGKGFLRTALKRLKLDYSPVRGEGIQLTDHNTASDAVVETVVKVDRAVKRGNKRVKNITKADYFSEIESVTKKDILCVSSMLETLANHSKGAKTFFQKPAPPKALN